jgi:acyl-CoA thioesterase-2
VSIATVLALDQVEPSVFRGHSRFPATQRVFGGEVAAQSLVAAGRTVPPGREPHSLHGYFVRQGDAAIPIDYRVEPIRDGGSYSTRRVTALQRGEAIFTLSASFAAPEEGLTHQVPQSPAGSPEGLPGPEEAMAGTSGLVRDWFLNLVERHPFELRFDGELPRVATARGERVAPRQRFWLRSREELPAGQMAHSCAATYASDMLLLSTSVALHGTMLGVPELRFASLDHAVWFHGPFRADEWLYYDQEGTTAASGRAMCQGRMFDRAGRLVVSVVQEGMIRLRPG